MYDVVALGELLIDFTTQSIDSDGYPTMAAHPGGAPANFLAAIAKFGGKVGMLGKVGTDTFGKLLTNTLRGAGIETKGLVAADDVFTTLAFVTLDENGDREFAFARKPGADTQLTFDELDLSLIARVPLRDALAHGRAGADNDVSRRGICKGTRQARHLRSEPAQAAVERSQ